MHKKMCEDIDGFIFDLDGVIVDTAKYHYLAWKELAKELGFDFSEKDNEHLKGVSRERSLEILLQIGKMESKFTDSEKKLFAERKNERYVEFIRNIKKNELLSGAEEFLKSLKEKNKKIALGSASKNSMMILENLGIKNYFDAIIDGNKTAKAKPDPEVFLLGAKELSLEPKNCVVFEDAYTGIMAAKSANMKVIAIGDEKNLNGADMYIKGLYEML